MKRECEHILSLSYGKDSLACLGAIELLGWPLGRIVHAEVWATDTIPADLPPMVEFKAKADKIIKERWGIEVEHIRARQCYEDLFYSVCHGEKSKIAGNIYGWPFQRGREPRSDEVFWPATVQPDHRAVYVRRPVAQKNVLVAERAASAVCYRYCRAARKLGWITKQKREQL